MQVSGVHIMPSTTPFTPLFTCSIEDSSTAGSNGKRRENCNGVTRHAGSSGTTEPRKRVSKQGQLWRRGSFPTGSFSLESSPVMQLTSFNDRLVCTPAIPPMYAPCYMSCAVAPNTLYRVILADFSNFGDVGSSAVYPIRNVASH